MAVMSLQACLGNLVSLERLYLSSFFLVTLVLIYYQCTRIRSDVSFVMFFSLLLLFLALMVCF